MNQVLARSLNTSLVAIMPILSILVIGAWVLGATALEDFGLALFVGLTTGAYSSIFIASPLLALLKEREPRYSEIRRRLEQSGRRRLTPAAVASDVTRALDGDSTPASTRPQAPAATRPAAGVPEVEVEYGNSGIDAANGSSTGSIPLLPPRSGNRPPPRPRKKGRRR
jgi:preprotein translocase subunit SecF